MAVTTSGAEFRRFNDDSHFWGADAYYEDAIITVDGKEQPEGVEQTHLSDTATVVISDGNVYDSPNGDGVTLERFFKKWLKQQTTCTLVVECDNTILDAVKAAIKAAGGRVK